MKSLIISYILLSSMLLFTYGQSEIYVYGPGGPAPAMKDAAAQYGKETGIKIIVIAGPTKDWIEEAKGKGDIIFSGSEHMMTDFINDMNGLISTGDVLPLYLRPSAVLVRKGNPMNIKKFADLLEPGVQILVVNGAGQTGLWEDIAAKDGNIETLRKFRNNISYFAKNSAEAKKVWTENQSNDAWLIWNIWQVSDPDIADIIELEPEYTLYRDCAVVLTSKGKNTNSQGFIDFLDSEKGKSIFSKWGWITE
jgi:accessory colonization factor AcfC